MNDSGNVADVPAPGSQPKKQFRVFLREALAREQVNQQQKKGGGLFERARTERKALAQLLVVAVVLGVAINLIAGLILSATSRNAWEVATFAGVASAISVIYLAMRVGKRKHVLRVLGFIAISSSEGRLIEVPKYGLATAVAAITNSVFHENPALRAQWEQNPLRVLHSEAPKIRCLGDRHEVAACEKSRQLLKEAVEHYVISELSKHLTDYNVHAGNYAGELAKMRRQEMPQVLLQNRVTDLLTRPVSERINLMNLKPPFELTRNAEIARIEHEGTMYDAVGLYLPKGSTISREHGELVITTKRFTSRVLVHVSGSAYPLPPLFKGMYVERDVEAVEVELVMKTEFTRAALFSGRGIRFYRWIDSFAAHLNEVASAERFFQRIGWETVSTLLVALDSPRGRDLLSGRAPDDQPEEIDDVHIVLVRGPAGEHAH